MIESHVIDWEAVRERLARNRAAAETALSPDAGRIRAVYRERAARLARTAGPGAVERKPVLVFRLGSERYGIELSHVVEVLGHSRCSPVPGAPPQLAGVLQVQGEIRPVWELTRLLGLPELSAGGPEYAVLLRSGRRERGLRVNQVEGVQLVEQHRGIPAGSRHVKWTTPDLIAVLDPASLWNEES